jgi:hypothetical protein
VKGQGTKTMTNLFAQISVNVATGAISYPQLPGFKLDMERLYSTAQLHLPFCNGSIEMAVRHAIHGQLTAHQGLAQLLRANGEVSQ